jgi:hypothetical protein
MYMLHMSARWKLISSGGFEGGPGVPTPPPLFVWNLPSNISTTQDFKPKYFTFLLFLRGGPLSPERAHLFEIYGSATEIIIFIHIDDFYFFTVFLMEYNPFQIAIDRKISRHLHTKQLSEGKLCSWQYLVNATR